jgi:SAM-dependent methyltransferase
MNSQKQGDFFNDIDLITRAIVSNKYLPKPEPEKLPNKKIYWSLGPGLMKALVLEGLKPDDRVMDIGSGFGRVAVPLTQVLNEKGSYLGIDIDPERISWCNKNIHRIYNNFKFHLLDVGNRHFKTSNYGTGKSMAMDDLPDLEKNSFDFIFAYSLFTHLPKEETEIYFRFVDTYLKKSGTFYATWFLINNESRNAIENKTNKRFFCLDTAGPDYYENKDSSQFSSAIGYDEDYVLSLGKQNNLIVKPPVKYGSWREGKGGQDRIAFTRSR